MSVTRATFIFLGLVYVLLWAFEINGATNLLGPLLVPPILGAIVAMGVALNRYMGIKPREQHFQDPEDDPPS